MLQITKKVEYGLIALVYIGRCDGRSVSAREVSEHNALPLSLTANVLKSLAKQGVLATRRGSSGGYTLERALKEITLKEVVAAVEGDMNLTSCCRQNGLGGCELIGSCSIKAAIVQLNSKLLGGLGSLSLDDLMAMSHGPAKPLAS
jgi:Rrf2 family protein